MSTLITIQSKSHCYSVEACDNLDAALRALPEEGMLCLADKAVCDLYRSAFDAVLPATKVLCIEATEEAKSYDALPPVFAWLLSNGLRRNGCLAVVGGGVLQDIGCFIASVLFRGVRWELIPTTLLAQCDSCIGSKSSLNIQSWKNQLGTFYPPHRVLLTTSILRTLPRDEIRSGIGEAIKLHLLAGEAEFKTLMEGLDAVSSDPSTLAPWILSSLRIQKPFIEQDEFDRDIRNILNYGHTFGHSFESATHYAIPHGIAVTLGVLAATFTSMRLGLVGAAHYESLKQALRPWHEPYGRELKAIDLELILGAVKRDKKNTRDAVNCILTRGFGRMEKMPLRLDEDLRPVLADFIMSEIEIGH